MITTQTLVAGLMMMTHGHAVAEQFEATYSSDESFDDQNLNALRKIQATGIELLNSNILNVEENDELENYIVDLNEYLANQ